MKQEGALEYFIKLTSSRGEMIVQQLYSNTPPELFKEWFRQKFCKINFLWCEENKMEEKNNRNIHFIIAISFLGTPKL